MKKFLTIIGMLMLTVCVNAQSKAYVGNKFFDNWSIGINGGIQTNLHDWNAPQGAVAGITLDKQITPMFGLTGEVCTGINNRMNWYSGASHIHNGTAFDQLYVFADGRVNLMNAIAGYKNKPRHFEIDALVGVGYGHGYANYEAGKTDALLAKAGLNLNYNVDKKRAWTLSLRPAVIWNVTPTGKFDSRLAVGQLTVGVTYHFKSSNKKHYMTQFEPVVIERVKEVVKEVPTEVVKTVEKEVAPEVKTITVPFGFNSAKLTDDSKAKLDVIDTTKTVVINGYSSYDGKKSDKQSDYNKTLSASRAETVKAYLEGKGIKVESATGNGIHDLGRVVVVDIK